MTLEASMDEQVLYVQQLFDANARLNGDDDVPEAYAIGDQVHWRARHRVSGKTVGGRWRGATRPPTDRSV